MKRILSILICVLLIAGFTYAEQGSPFNNPGKSEINAESITTNSLDITTVTDGNIPYMQPSGAGFGDSPVWTDGTNVGIGTSSPSSELHIAGDGQPITLQATEAYNSSPTPGITFQGKYNAAGGVAGWASIRAPKATAVDGDYGGGLTFWTRPNGGATTQRMVVDSSGLIGINTTTPTAQLDVKASTNDGSTDGFLVEDSDGTTISTFFADCKQSKKAA